MALITEALPPALRTRLEAYCRVTGDDPDDVVHDVFTDWLDDMESQADAVAADPLLQDGDALSRAVAKAMSS